MAKHTGKFTDQLTSDHTKAVDALNAILSAKSAELTALKAEIKKGRATPEFNKGLNSVIGHLRKGNLAAAQEVASGLNISTEDFQKITGFFREHGSNEFAKAMEAHNALHLDPISANLANPPLSTEVASGTLHFENGKIEIKGVTHPGLDAAKKEFESALTELRADLEKLDLSKVTNKTEKAELKAGLEALKANNIEGVSKAQRTIGKHLRPSMEKAVNAGHKVVDAESALIHTKQRLILEAQADLTKVTGHTPENAEAVKTALGTLDKELTTARDALSTRIKDGLSGHMKGMTRTAGAEPAAGTAAANAAEKAAGEGFWARQLRKAKANLGAEAWKESKVKTGFRTAGVALGASMVVDAALRSKARDDEGNEVERSGAARMIEAAAGMGVGAGSALIGGR